MEDSRLVSVLRDLDLNISKLKILESVFSKPDDYKVPVTAVLTFQNSHVLYNGQKVGSYKNIPKELSRYIVMRGRMEDFLDSSREVYNQCTVPNNSSNSPSMMLHQLVALCFGLSLKSKVQWEETMGKYKPDLLMDIKGVKVLIDITGKNHESKLAHMPDDYPCISIDKYKMIPNISDEMNLLYQLSKLNDDCNVSFIYERVNAQASGNEMLYNERLLEFFSRKDKFPVKFDRHSEISLNVLYDSMDNLIEEITESKEENITELIEEFCSKNSKDLKSKVAENKYFIFPRINLGHLETRKAEDQKVFLRDIITDTYWDFTDDKEEVKQNNLYERTDLMIINDKSYLALKTYVDDKMCKRRELKEYYLNLHKLYGYGTAAWKHLVLEKVYNRLGISIDGKSRSNKESKGFSSQKMIHLRDFDIRTSFINEAPLDIDPDHARFLELRSCQQLIPMLARLRDYSDMRFKHRVSQSIAFNKKDNSTFRVNHWKIESFYAIVKIRGLVLDKDKGVCYVSYFDGLDLIRTEKWRLSDIENYSVAHHRLIAICAGFVLTTKRNIKLSEMSLYARILAENSWGLSKFLKIYRYLSSGIAMSSKSISKTLEKLQDSIDNPVRSKLSYRLMLNMLNYSSKTSKINLGKTPMFQLDFEFLGFESFLVNLCPSNTYGKLRHLESTCKDLADEIDLYDMSFGHVKEIYRDFMEIIEEKDESIIYQRYKSHIGKISSVSSITNERFTHSPFSNLVLFNEISKTKMNYALFQGSLPNLSQLMTAKASTYSYTGASGKAVDTIADLSIKYSCTSTSLLGLKILTKKGLIDLSMRVFDKDQVGGDREISILTSEFRILQCITEKFFEKWALLTGIDVLHDKNKTKNLLTQFDKTLHGSNTFYFTGDQTRWGPNFNTICFGLMSLMIAKETTEAYIPALICLMSEFKVFEMPSWLPRVFSRSNYSYGIIGKLARSHMGQGIFHQSSSLYHSYVIATLMTYIKSFLTETDDNQSEDRKSVV